MCVLKYISYISYIRFFEGLKMPYLQGFSKSYAHRYPPICSPLPPLFCYCLAMLLLSGCSCKSLKTGVKQGDLVLASLL